MKSFALLLVCVFISAVTIAAVGDTTKVKVFDKVPMNHYGNFDKWGMFPDAAKKYQRIWMTYTVGCESNGQCEWDYTNTLYVRHRTGIIDSTLKQAPSFKVNGQVKDSIAYSSVATWVNTFNATTKTTDSAEAVKLMVVRFQDTVNPLNPTDTMSVWPVNYYRYSYDSTGNKFDSSWVSATNVLHLTNTAYYSKAERVIDYEIGRIITPYAKFFPKTFQYQYTFDVTDFVQLLKDSAEIRLNYSGYSWGFTATIGFDFVEGIPAREVVKIEQVYNGYFPYGNASNSIENYLTAKPFTVDNNTSAVKLRVAVTGHGMDQAENCAEFCKKSYYVKVDNVQVAQRLIWKANCGSNAIINQGGTWIYDRSNWCPGEQVKVYEYYLIAPAGAHTLDIDMDPFTANGSAGYGYGVQLVHYKSAAVAYDAAIEDILAPSKNFWYSRFNPVCDNARILLKNFGSQPLTSATIKYQTGDGIVQSYSWAGNLAYDASVEVTLPGMIWDNPSGAEVFSAWIDQVNGQADQNTLNDRKTSTYEMPQVMQNPFVIEARTNLKPEDNSYIIKNASGATVFSRSFSTANFIHRDTFNLPHGCYAFEFTDIGGNGLAFWNPPVEGTGSVRFVKNPINQTGPVLKTFNPDFGNFLLFNFRIGSSVGVESSAITVPEITVYPSPASDFVHISSGAAFRCIELLSYDGRLISTQKSDDITDAKVELNDIAAGLYFVRVTGENGLYAVKKLTVIK